MLAFRPSMLLAVRIQVPVPDELQLPLAIVGALILAAAYLFYGRAMIREDRRAGWSWIVGTCAVVPFAVSVLWVFGRMSPDEAAPGLLPAALLGAMAAGGMAGARWWKASAIIAGAGGLALGLKLFVRPLVEHVSLDGGHLTIFPAPITDPVNLVLLALSAALLGFATHAMVRARRHPGVREG